MEQREEEQRVGENCILNSFTICYHRQISLVEAITVSSVQVLCRTILLTISTFYCFDMYSLRLLYHYYLYHLIA